MTETEAAAFSERARAEVPDVTIHDGGKTG
jgi:hypothetical protein